MRRSRIHVDQPLQGGVITLHDEAAHYLGTVLRARAGQAVALFNGRDGEFHGDVTAVRKRELDITLQPEPAVLPEALLPIHIGLGLSRGERMDYAVQKATELGVTAITPLFTEFSEVRLDASRSQKRTAHWQKIAISASEQCGRCQVPVINNPVNLDEWLRDLSADARFLLDHSGTPGFPVTPGVSDSGTAGRPNSVALLIGPEGGISDTEKTLATDHHFQAVRLGPRILRTETAPVVALTALQLLWGDFRSDLDNHH